MRMDICTSYNPFVFTCILFILSLLLWSLAGAFCCMHI